MVSSKNLYFRKGKSFFRNSRKDITKAPVFYFCDLGLRNYATGEFGSLGLQAKGRVFENFIFNILRRKINYTPSKIHFWRTKEGAEVDFVILSGKRIIPVEAKYKELKKPKITRSLRSFISKYQPEKAFVVNLNFDQKIILNNTEIHFIPFYKLFEIEP